MNIMENEMSDLREKLIDIVEDSSTCYFNGNGERLIMIQTINFLFDKYDLDELCSQWHISKKDYEKYFKEIVKNYNPDLHKKAKKYYKEKKHES